MIRLAEPPQLVWPTVDVRVSYLVGEQADCMLRGTPTHWLEAASEDFARFVAARRGVQIRWGVPSTSDTTWWRHGGARVTRPGCWPRGWSNAAG